jgi:glycosyltransferase involved in cell wall biosynthesis
MYVNSDGTVENDKLVSIITPLYNSERFIGQTIESVLAQTYPHWEMLVVNDGSCDEGAYIVRRYAKQDARIHLFEQPNSGCAAARNHGLREAKGRYYVFLDSDDYWDPTFLESQLAFMHARKAAIVTCSIRRVDEEGKEVLRPQIVPERMDYYDVLKSCNLPCLATVIDASRFRDIRFREELHNLRDDYALWLSLMKQTDYAYGNPQVLANYRISAQQVTGNKRKVIIPQFMVYYKVEQLGLCRSLYYLVHWAWNGYRKYRK